MKIIHGLFAFLLLPVLICSGFFYSNKTDSLLLELKNNLPDSIKVKTLIDIVEHNELSKDSTNFLIKEALKTAEHSKRADLISRAMHYLTHWHIGNTRNQDTILFHCRSHLQRMQQMRYAKGVALALSNLGGAYTWYSLDSSLFYNWKTVELYKELKEFKSANTAKINLANVYLEMKRYNEAIDIYRQTVDFFIKNGNSSEAGLSYFNMSECYVRLGDLANAEKYINKGCALNDTSTHESNMAYCYAMLGDVFVVQGKTGEAKTMYERILSISTPKNTDYILYRAYKGLADVSFKNAQWNDAINYKKLSWNYSYKDLDTKQSLYKMLYACDSALGNYKTSLIRYQQYIAVRDSYENVERLKNADALEARYKSKEKQSQIELLDKEKQLQAAEIEKQHLLRNLIIILVAVLIAAGGLLFNRFRLKRKIEQQNALLTERKRISRELHDDLGAQLSTAKMFLQSVKGKSQSDYTSIDNSLSLIESSIHDLRTIMDDLQTSTLRDRGYIAATEELVNRVNQLQQINFSLTHHAIEKRLDEKTEHHLFRITQELINNTIKYAQAKNVNLDLLKRDNKIVLMYEDDGVGFDLQNNKRGYGLDNIVSRIQTISGTVEFDTSVNNGFRCVIEV